MDILPRSVRAEEANRTVLNHLQGRSAHSDLVQPLSLAIDDLPHAAIWCADTLHYGYVIAYANGFVFAFAEGMNSIGLRLPPEAVRVALDEGAMSCSEAGPEWVSIPLFSPTRPVHDFPHWLRTAFLHAIRP